MSAPHAETEPDQRDRSSPVRDAVSPVPGTRIGRYVVLSRLGAGGMGVVLAAYDPQLDRKIALKVLRTATGGSEGREARRLLREAMAMARLTHPNVITVHDVGEHEGQVYISMELVEGTTLEQRLASRPRWPEVLELFIAAGRGLAAAHAKGLVHRDFKPENVMIGDDGRVRVMDFGLAHDAAPDSTRFSLGQGEPVVAATGGSARADVTHAGRIAGTPGYIAPELHLGELADPRSDQFAFGVALYEGLFGARPFVGDTVFAIAASTMAGQVREISSKSDVPGWVRRIVLRALAVAPADRFPSMDAMLDELAQHDTRRRSRRRLALVLGGVGFVGGVGAMIGLEERRARARCVATGDAIADSWSDDIRVGTRAGFLRDAPPFAAAAWDKSEGWLDRYAADWRRTRIEVCTATTIDERRSVELETRSIACLDGRRRVLDAVVRQLADGGEAIVLAAVDATSGLPTLAPCLDDGALMRTPAGEPDDPAARDELADALAAQLGDRPREGVELARSAAARAMASGAIAVEIDARLRLASGLDELGEYPAAVAECEQAFYLAGKSGDDAAAAEAASAAAGIAGGDLRDVETAMRWVPLAEMSLGRLGEQQSPRVGDCLFDLARAELAAAHYDRAEELLGRARTIIERELDPEHPRVAHLISHLAMVAEARGQYERAGQLEAQALALLERIFGADHPQLGTTLNNIGNSLDARGRYDEAQAMYERALALWQRSLGEDHPRYAETLVNLATIDYRKGDYDGATSKAMRALSVFERAFGPDSAQVATCLNNLVNFAASKGDFDTAEAYQARSLAIREASLPADHPELAGSLTQFGLLVAARPDPDAAALARARSHLERALGIWQRKFGDSHPDSAFALHALGIVLAAQGETDAAIGRLEHALRLRTGPDTPGYSRAETLFALADVLRGSKRDPVRARALATEALELYRSAGEMFAPQLGDVEAFLAER